MISHMTETQAKNKKQKKNKNKNKKKPKPLITPKENYLCSIFLLLGSNYFNVRQEN